MINRRDMLKSTALLTAASLVPFGSVFASNNANIKPLTPPRLQLGDTIGLAVPGSPIDEKELADSIANIEALGFKVYHSNRILAKHGYLAGTDKERADDINELFANNKVKAIVCARGGYGSQRIADMIDYDLVKKHPKIVMGYSDITSLLYCLHSQTGLVCFHGPVATSTFNDYSLEHLKNILYSPQNEYTMESAKDEDPTKTEYNRVVINSGVAVGALVGGNLSVFVSIIGSKYDISLDDKILFIEEVHEEPYRIDRMLTQMLQAGKFDKVKGIAMGVFKGCEEKRVDPSFKNSLTLIDVLKDRLGHLKIPIMYGLSFGHIVNKMTLPFGVKARLDTESQTLTLLENAVI